MSIKKQCCAAVALMLCGCGSQIASIKERTQSWIGHPINEIKEGASLPNVYDKYKAAIGWKETTYNLPNGNWVYVELNNKNCFIHWEVNPQGIIVGAHTKGTGCKFH